MMPYQPYNPTWQNPYLPLTNQGQPVSPMVQPNRQTYYSIVVPWACLGTSEAF